MFKRILTITLAFLMLLMLSISTLAFSGEDPGSMELPTAIPESAESRITAKIYADGDEVTDDGVDGVYIATEDDQSCVYAKNGSVYVVEGALLTKPSGILSTATSFTVPTGEVLWSTTEAGSYGINAAVLATDEKTVLTIRDSVIRSYNLGEDGRPVANDPALIGANGVFATMGARIVLEHVVIIAAGEGGHGIDVTSDGCVEISDSTVITYGKKASGLTTDQPGGTVLATDVQVLTYQSGSAAVYCDGSSFVSVDGGTLESWVEPAAVVCTDGVLELKDVVLVSHGDAALNAHFPSQPSTITCTGCSFISESTSAVTSYAATNMVFDDCSFFPAEGGYIFASIPGENSSGGISADKATVTMKNCSLIGGIWADEENGAAVNLILENTEWLVTVECVLTSFTVDEYSTVCGVMLVDGVETAIEAGSYANVTLTPVP